MALKKTLYLTVLLLQVPLLIFAAVGDVNRPTNLTDYAAPLLPLNNPLPLQEAGKMRRKMQSTPSTQQQADEIKQKEFPWNLTFSLLIAGASLLIFRLKKKKPVPLLKQRLALIHLQKAEKLNPLKAPNLIKEYFSELVQALRCHLEEQFTLNTTAMTTEEFLQSKQLYKILRVEQNTQLEEFLTLADAVKFGGYEPTHNEIDLAWQYIVNVIH